MDLIARHFECFPAASAGCATLGRLIAALGDIAFPVTVGTRNSNQLTYGFDSRLEATLLGLGATKTTIALPPNIHQTYDFAFSFAGKRVVVEVEKANWEKILRDILKFHLYFKHGADLALLFLPKNYPHSHGEPDNFQTGRELYQQCLDCGFGQAATFDRILLVGYEQFTAAGQRFTSVIRNSLKTPQNITSPAAPA